MRRFSFGSVPVSDPEGMTSLCSLITAPPILLISDRHCIRTRRDDLRSCETDQHPCPRLCRMGQARWHLRPPKCIYIGQLPSRLAFQSGGFLAFNLVKILYSLIFGSCHEGFGCCTSRRSGNDCHWPPDGQADCDCALLRRPRKALHHLLNVGARRLGP